MNWFDYTRGYDHGIEDYSSRKNNNSLLFFLLHLALSIVTLFFKLSFFILKGLAVLLWGIIRIMAGRQR